MANQTNNKKLQNEKSVAEAVKNADWSAFQSSTENAATSSVDANATTGVTNPNKANQ